MAGIIDGLRYSWKKNLDYAQRLVADLADEQMILQPCSSGFQPANHPAWIFSHLNVYVPIIASLIKGEEFPDPKSHQFGMESKPEDDASLYASKLELIDSFSEGHITVDDLLAAASESILQQHVKLARWQSVMPTVAIALPYLMLVHENMHLGQLSAWRRIQGMPGV